MEQTIISNDTIVAVATPHGRGAIAIVRLSGKDAFDIADKIWKGTPLHKADSHTAHLGFIYAPSEKDNTDATPIDQALATIFKGPNSFTGEDLVEFGLHGSPLIARQVMSALIEAGAHPAGPGEFSQRSVANGRMSLLSAESAADLVAASSKAARRIAMTQMRGGVERTLQQMQNKLLNLASLLELELDFSEEDVEFASRDELRELALSVKKHLEDLSNSFRTGQAIKDGIPVAIVGPTNAGKSSLLNALLNDNRAIVSDIHGTTRDIIEDTLEIGDYLFRFMDTAGLRKTEDPIEQIGISQSKRALSRARIVILTTDSTLPLPENLVTDTLNAMAPDATLILLRNKSDLTEASDTTCTTSEPPISLNISTKTGLGIDTLKQHLNRIICDEEAGTGDILLTNERHYQCVQEALTALERVLTMLPAPPSANTSASSTPSPDLVAQPLYSPDIIARNVREVISPLSELTGTALQTPALLQHIFSHFCIGK